MRRHPSCWVDERRSLGWSAKEKERLLWEHAADSAEPPRSGVLLQTSLKPSPDIRLHTILPRFTLRVSLAVYLLPLSCLSLIVRGEERVSDLQTFQLTKEQVERVRAIRNSSCCDAQSATLLLLNPFRRFLSFTCTATTRLMFNSS